MAGRCEGRQTKPGGNFEFSALLTETLLLGNVASQTGQKLKWNRVNLKVRIHRRPTKSSTRPPPGWEL